MNNYVVDVPLEISDVKMSDPKYYSKCLRIEQGISNNPIHILVECNYRPNVGVDIINHHGRRMVYVRIDGFTIASVLLDVKHLDTAGEPTPRRYCPICGEKINLTSSHGHICQDDPKKVLYK